MSKGKCFETPSETHTIEWIRVSGWEHNGVQVSEDHERGFCWACGQSFIR